MLSNLEAVVSCTRPRSGMLDAAPLPLNSPPTKIPSSSRPEMAVHLPKHQGNGSQMSRFVHALRTSSLFNKCWGTLGHHRGAAMQAHAVLNIYECKWPYNRKRISPANKKIPLPKHSVTPKFELLTILPTLHPRCPCRLTIWARASTLSATLRLHWSSGSCQLTHLIQQSKHTENCGGQWASVSCAALQELQLHK